MKVIYISSIAYSDVDISMLIDAQKIMDITYVGLVGINNRRSCAIDLRDSDIHLGINYGVEIPQLQKFRTIIDLHKVIMFCTETKHAYEPKAFLRNYQLYRFIIDGGYDVVHLTSVPSFLNPFMYLLRKRLVVTIHDPLPHSSATYKMEKYNRLITFKYINNLILLNQSQINDFIEVYKIKKTRTNIYQSSLSCYTYLKMYDVNEIKVRQPYILFFGNVTGYKGLDYLFPAMKKVHVKCPDLKLVAAGGGKYYFNIEEYENCSYMDIRNSFIPDDELASLIANCEFVVVPYIDATQSGVIMSAYAFNKPCIATNVGGLPEMVIDGQYGRIIPPKNELSLSDSILELHNNQQLLNVFASNISNDYQQGSKSWLKISQQLLKIYKNIMNQN